MIDIHSHMLQNVDDGSVNLAMSIEMAKIYVENGFKGVILTPHYIEGIDNNSRLDNQIKFIELRYELENQDLDIEIYLGHEVLLSLEMVEKLEDGTISTLNDSRYVLVELPMYDIPIYVEDVFYNLQLKGYIPIIAHPERNIKIMEDPNILMKYIKNGALAQLNLPSLDERYGKDVCRNSELLLKHNMIHFVSTDAHTSSRRSPHVKNAIKRLKSLVSEEQFQNLTYKNAELLIEDKDIAIENPIEYKKNRQFFNLFNKK